MHIYNIYHLNESSGMCNELYNSNEQLILWKKNFADFREYLRLYVVLLSLMVWK